KFCFRNMYNFFRYIFRSSMAWEVKMPRHIKGLLNSCLVIPCTFDYDQNPPRRPDRVVWYQNVERGYPLVYDNWNPGQVIYAFRGKTERIYSTSKTCSLRIYPVTWSHHRQKIYPWVDPENIWSSTYRFFDTTVTIEVDSTPEKPLITFLEGQPSKVSCTALYTCPKDVPVLTWNYDSMPTSTDTKEIAKAQWRTVSTLMFTASGNDNGRTLTCYATFGGGRRQEERIILRVKSALNYNHIIIPIVVAIGIAVTFGVLCIFIVKRYK
uniref:Ig-like domain-containing protein n=1 Tax=Anabas testudineus TaxID=64144 RepID=A0A3Q1I5K5_ANATE